MNIREAVDRYIQWDAINNENRKRLLSRHAEELEEFERYCKHDSDPFRVALKDDYSLENVEILAEALRKRLTVKPK
jgi:hypothetical protein